MDMATQSIRARPAFLPVLAQHWPIFIGLVVLLGPTLFGVATQSWTGEAGVHGPIVLATGIWLFARFVGVPVPWAATRQTDAVALLAFEHQRLLDLAAAGEAVPTVLAFDGHALVTSDIGTTLDYLLFQREPNQRLPLMTAAKTAGGAVSVLADADVALPATLAGVPVRVLPERQARHALFAEEAEVLVALPGSLASASALFGSWASTRGRSKPVVMLNRHRAFEVVKGFAGDVLSHSVAGYDRNVQFADSVEDLWNKVSWVLEQKR